MAKTELSVESLISSAISLPVVKIDREEFLTNQLSKIVSPQMLQDVLANGTIEAKIPQNVLDNLATKKGLPQHP